MSDWTDDASEQEQVYLDAALARQAEQARQHEAALGAASGWCLNCDAELTVGRFCDADCREDFQKRMRITQRRH